MQNGLIFSAYASFVRAESLEAIPLSEFLHLHCFLISSSYLCLV